MSAPPPGRPQPSARWDYNLGELEDLASAVNHRTGTLKDAAKLARTAHGAPREISHQHLATVCAHFKVPLSRAGRGRPRAHVCPGLRDIVAEELEKHPDYGYKAMATHLQAPQFAQSLQCIPAGPNEVRRVYNEKWPSQAQ
jgi:hypothetical protein